MDPRKGSNWQSRLVGSWALESIEVILCCGEWDSHVHVYISDFSVLLFCGRCSVLYKTSSIKSRSSRVRYCASPSPNPYSVIYQDRGTEQHEYSSNWTNYTIAIEIPLVDHS